MEEAGFVDVRRWEYKVPFCKGLERDMLDSGRMTEHVVGDPLGSLLACDPRLYERSGYEVEKVERMMREMRNDLKEEWPKS